MTRPSFALFQSHLDLAHLYWRRHIDKNLPGTPPVIIDATCGNGHDSLVLAKIGLIGSKGALYCIDAQKQAIEATRNRLSGELSEEVLKKITFFHQSHEQFPQEIPPSDLIVYNLGYLPGGDKAKTTLSSTTLLSLQNALLLAKPGGLISITCYPGHPAGAEEETILIEYTSQLPPDQCLICHHKLLNRHLAPSLLLIFKKN